LGIHLPAGPLRREGSSLIRDPAAVTPAAHDLERIIRARRLIHRRLRTAINAIRRRSPLEYQLHSALVAVFAAVEICGPTVVAPDHTNRASIPSHARGHLSGADYNPVLGPVAIICTRKV